MDNLWWHSKARWTTRKVFVALFVAGVATIASALELGPTMMKEEVLLIVIGVIIIVYGLSSALDTTEAFMIFLDHAIKEGEKLNSKQNIVNWDFREWTMYVERGVKIALEEKNIRKITAVQERLL